jgi:hypothetical protein
VHAVRPELGASQIRLTLPGSSTCRDLGFSVNDGSVFTHFVIFTLIHVIQLQAGFASDIHADEPTRRRIGQRPATGVEQL